MGLWEKFIKFLDQRVVDFGAQYKNFGLFGIINFPVSYFIMFYYLGTKEIAITRFIALLLCVPLIFTDYWSPKTKKYLNLYWFLTLLYCFPIFGTYMLLENHLSTEWLMNIPLGLFLLILLVDWVIFIILLSLGISLGYLLFITSGQEVIIQNSFTEISLASYLYTYCFSIIIGLVFARSHERTHQEKLRTMKMLAGSIAHELRTPLSAMMMSARTLKKLLPPYQEAYAKAKASNLLGKTVEPDQEEYLANLPQNMQTVSQNAHTMITMLLTNLNNEGAADRKVEPCSMALCVEEALKTYPFSLDERSLVHWPDSKDIQTDFTFLGHKELVKHVLFNLFKNALYAIASAGKGEIFITIESGENSPNQKTNRLIFKDTGPGIPSANLRHIFDRFYTRKEHGAGIGLAFCQSVIQGFGGEITCASREGEYTTFTISFPRLNKSSVSPGTPKGKFAGLKENTERL